MAPTPNRLLNNVNLLLDRLDASDDAPPRRIHKRFRYRHPAIACSLRGPDQMTPAEVAVATRNLSAGGCSILHSAFVYPGTICTLHLPVPGGVDTVRGNVVFCAHREHVVHEIGVRFSEEVDIRRYITASELGFRHEKVDHAVLRGAVLVADDAPMDRRIIEHFLKDTRLTLHMEGDDAIAALTEARTSDLVLVGMQVGFLGAPEWLDRCREDGVDSPAILLTADIHQFEAERASGRWAAVLRKPIDQATLLRAIAEHLEAPEVPDPDLAEHGEARDALLEPFFQALVELADALLLALQNDDPKACVRALRTIVSVGPALGFHGLASKASRTVQIIHDAGSLRDPRAEATVRRMVQLCRSWGQAA